MSKVIKNKEIKKRKISLLTKINTTFFFVSILFSIFAEKFNKHMISKKEKWKMGWLCTFGILFLLHYNYPNSDGLKIFTVSAFLLGVWDLFFNHRRFVMTEDELCSVDNGTKLKYCLRESCDYTLLKNVFVKFDTLWFNNWLELDYRLTIPKEQLSYSFNEFEKTNSTVGQLSQTMNYNMGKTASIDSFDKYIRNYEKKRVTSLIIVILTILVYALCLFENASNNYFYNDYFYSQCVG